ncbi:hypothetical protein [Sphingobium sp. HWE2-09]|uniref:hypothetical protein n=1 Tax=Sphingobium sp. HWE2-09 TaxID=3108390 RepID=UPI002DCE5DA2|nr:hypothetical protein [Sphingobium sp. HWE2-09]
MATWSSYQSLIQLAAALNFGFAGFDFLFVRRLEEAKKARENMVRQMLAERKQGAARPTLSAARNSAVKSRLEKLANVEAAKARWNATFSVISGIVSIFLLGYMSVAANDEASIGFLVSFIFVSYLWFSISLMWMLGARTYLRFFVTRFANGDAK